MLWQTQSGMFCFYKLASLSVKSSSSSPARLWAQHVRKCTETPCSTTAAGFSVLVLWKGKALQLWPIHFRLFLCTVCKDPLALQLPFGVSCGSNGILCLGLRNQKWERLARSICPYPGRRGTVLQSESLRPLPWCLSLTRSEGTATLCSRRPPHTPRARLDPCPLFLAHHCLTSSIYPYLPFAYDLGSGGKNPSPPLFCATAITLGFTISVLSCPSLAQTASVVVHDCSPVSATGCIWFWALPYCQSCGRRL